MEEQVNKVIEEQINPMLALHEGSCELLSVEGGIAEVKLNGGCVGCPSAKITLYNGIRPILMDNVDGLKDVTLGGF